MTTERERFEAWAEQNVGQPDFGGYHTDGGRWFYRHNFIRMCWGAWQAALAHACSAEPPTSFAEWVRKNIPPGTIISDPEWWIPRMYRAARAEPQRPLDDEGLALLREARRWLGDGELSDDLPREYWTKQYADAVDAIDAYLAKPRQQQEPVGYQMTEADGPWKSAVIDALIVDCIYSNEHENDPRKAIADLLAWECRLALDPAVSKEAAALRDSGKMTEADIRQAYEHGWTDAMHVATGGIEVPAEREAAWQASNARAHLMQFVVSGG